ncbi:MAG: 16S rRNA (cytosine(1402)-N(4))-methyltransferase RsmH [Myxococcales bacterium]|nr:16S rRNA (cytosine(1402)-N(4))-methyltransferase RsmH [Myxococcales bacterium]
MLSLRPGSLVVDGTLGDGGHAEAILERTAPDGRLLGLDWDGDALRVAGERLAVFGERAILVRASFAEIEDVLEERGVAKIDALLLDLGVSSRQLDQADRGFRFRDAQAGIALDMRMDRRRSESAADLVAEANVEELTAWFSRFGELPGSKRLARALVEARKNGPIVTAADLVRLIEASGIGRGRRHHPATLVFQALRLATNDELGALESVLEAAPRCLRADGRLAVISYHSLEDRIVKNALRDGERGCVCPPKLPVCVCGRLPVYRRLVKRPISPSDEEIARNPRARSAKLRGAVRLPEAA